MTAQYLYSTFPLKSTGILYIYILYTLYIVVHCFVVHIHIVYSGSQFSVKLLLLSYR